MSKSMRELCKEEDFEFLGKPESLCKDKDCVSEEEKCAARREERMHRWIERKDKETQKLKQLEENRKQKEEQWRNHVAELTSSQEKTLRQRMDRIRNFKEFQKQVLLDEAEAEGKSGQDQVECILTQI